MAVSAFVLMHRADSSAIENVRLRIQHWCRQMSAKELARSLETQPRVRTVRGWREGDTAPGIDHLAAMVGLWGQAFLDDVFEPMVADPPDLMARLARIENTIRTVREGLVDENFKGAVARRDGALASEAGGTPQRESQADEPAATAQKPVIRAA